MVEVKEVYEEVTFAVMVAGDAERVAPAAGDTEVMTVAVPRVKVRMLVETPLALVTVVVMVLTPERIMLAEKVPVTLTTLLPLAGDLETELAAAPFILTVAAVMLALSVAVIHTEVGLTTTVAPAAGEAADQVAVSSANADDTVPASMTATANATTAVATNTDVRSKRTQLSCADPLARVLFVPNVALSMTASPERVMHEDNRGGIIEIPPDVKVTLGGLPRRVQRESPGGWAT
jgi:hypothetical protein